MLENSLKWVCLVIKLKQIATMKKNILLMLFLFSSVLLFAQQKITGTVTDENNEPLPGAAIMVKGTSSGSITDVNGNFELTATN